MLSRHSNIKAVYSSVLYMTANSNLSSWNLCCAQNHYTTDMTKFNGIILKIKSLDQFYPDMKFQLFKTKTRSTGPHIGWIKIDYGKCDDEPIEVIALMKADQEAFKIEANLNFFQNCQRFQNMWDWSATNCEGKRIMSEVVSHLNKDMKEDDPCCWGCSFNPNCFFLYCQLRKDNG